MSPKTLKTTLYPCYSPLPNAVWREKKKNQPPKKAIFKTSNRKNMSRARTQVFLKCMIPGNAVPLAPNFLISCMLQF